MSSGEFVYQKATVTKFVFPFSRPNSSSHVPTVRLIDFGCAIDMNLFPENTQFKKVGCWCTFQGVSNNKLFSLSGHSNGGLHLYRDEGEPTVDVSNGFVLYSSHRPCDAVRGVHAGVEEV